MSPLRSSANDLLFLRAFDEPLIPIGGEPTARDTKDLRTAIGDYLASTDIDDFAPITTSLEGHRDSAWNASLLACVGLAYSTTGRFSRALDAWHQSWVLGRDERNPTAGRSSTVQSENWPLSWPTWDMKPNSRNSLTSCRTEWLPVQPRNCCPAPAKGFGQCRPSQRLRFDVAHLL